jgi:hypothetical protein
MNLNMYKAYTFYYIRDILVRRQLKRHVVAFAILKLGKHASIQMVDNVDNFSCEDRGWRRSLGLTTCGVLMWQAYKWQAQVSKQVEPIPREALRVNDVVRVAWLSASPIDVAALRNVLLRLPHKTVKVAVIAHGSSPADVPVSVETAPPLIWLSDADDSLWGDAQVLALLLAAVHSVQRRVPQVCPQAVIDHILAFRRAFDRRAPGLFGVQVNEMRPGTSV